MDMKNHLLWADQYAGQTECTPFCKKTRTVRLSISQGMHPLCFCLGFFFFFLHS